MEAPLGLGTLGLEDMVGVEHQGSEVLVVTLDLEDTALLVWPGAGQVLGATGRGVLQDLVDLEEGLDWGDMAQGVHQDLADALVWVGLATVDHRLLWVESAKVDWEALEAVPSQLLQSCQISS